MLNPFHSDDFSIHVDRIRMKEPFLYFKGSRVEISKL